MKCWRICAINLFQSRNTLIILVQKNILIMKRNCKNKDLSPVKDWQNKTTDKIFDHISNAKVIKNNFEELVASLQIYCDDELIKKIRNLVNMTDDETYVDLQTTLCDSQYYKVNENDIDELYQKTHRDLEHLFYILKKS